LAFISDSQAADVPLKTIQTIPAKFELSGRLDRQQLLVSGVQSTNGRTVDLTRKSTFTSLTPKVVSVGTDGLVRPVGDGVGKVRITSAGFTAEVSVAVQHATIDLPIDFDRDVIPVFSKFACNSGPCHGKARGQNGFQLSLLGFDSQFDFDSLSKEARGRRVFAPEPSRSLLLTKPTGKNPHGGGIRLRKGEYGYQILSQWIETGMPRSQPETPELVKVTVFPDEQILGHEQQQQLLITAHFSNGDQKDVTHLTAFQSNESAIAGVSSSGVVESGKITGEAAIMARYKDQIAVSEISVPLVGSIPPEFYAKLPRKNLIDGHVWTKLQKLGLTPSEPAPDHKMVRRLFVDVIGRLPTPEETKDYLKNKSANKQVELIDHLLEQPEFAEHWANKWADLLRPNAYHVGIKTVLNYDFWIRDSFRKNKPYDQFVRELISARGTTFTHGNTTMFRDRRTPEDLTTIVSQLFLGIRLECARCHHHPFEVWGQKDFYSFAAYFANIGRKGTGISAPISGSVEMIFTSKKGSVKHPLTGEVLPPKPLFGTAPEIAENSDPREALAAWITSDDNPYFRQVMVNRVWADIMGRGIVEPIDDLRGTNPPTNGPLLEALANDFRDQKYDLKKLVKRITTSYVYGLSSIPGERNVVDTRNYSRHYRQRLRAEVLLDGFSEITLVQETFAATPAGTSAKEIWSHRIGSLFLDVFGRPDPNQNPPCERTTDTTVVQALHLMNSQNLFSKVTSKTGRTAQLAESDKTPAAIAEELYLLVYSRFPDAAELQLADSLFKKKGITRQQATEDLLWALFNTPEFVFKD